MEADALDEEAEFFSFGKNDLTQATFSFSREDAENKFLPMYINSGILKDNPFEILDEKGVGKLMRFAAGEGRTSSLWHRLQYLHASMRSTSRNLPLGVLEAKVGVRPSWRLLPPAGPSGRVPTPPPPAGRRRNHLCPFPFGEARSRS